MTSRAGKASDGPSAKPGTECGLEGLFRGSSVWRAGAVGGRETDSPLARGHSRDLQPTARAETARRPRGANAMLAFLAKLLPLFSRWDRLLLGGFFLLAIVAAFAEIDRKSVV